LSPKITRGPDILSAALDNVGAQMTVFPRKWKDMKTPSPETKCIAINPGDADFSGTALSNSYKNK